MAVVSLVTVSMRMSSPVCIRPEAEDQWPEGVLVSPGMNSLTVQVRMRPLVPAYTGPISEISVSDIREISGTELKHKSLLTCIQCVIHTTLYLHHSHFCVYCISSFN